MAILPTRAGSLRADDRASWSAATLGAALQATAERNPSGLALVDGDRRLSWSELLREVQACAEGLRRAGVKSGDVVSVMLPNWAEASIAMHAALRMGAVVNPIVAIYRDNEVQYILRQSKASVVVIPHRFRGYDYVQMMRRVSEALDSPPAVVVARSQEDLPEGFTRWTDFGVANADGAETATAGDVCLLLYTSGTTSDPKGVLHSHHTLDYEIRSIAALFELGSNDTVFMPSPLTHITGFLFGVVMPTLTGAPAVLLDVWQPERAHRLIEDEQCRFTMAATPFLTGLVEQYEQQGGTSALQVFTCGGADVPPELIRRARKVMATCVVRVYGSSEFPTACCGGLHSTEGVAADTDGLPIGAGRMRVDGAVGTVGELLLQGPELFLGYLDADLNVSSFTDDGWFRTGDLASIDGDGAVTIRGRIKDIIVRGGENISAKEIEDLLFEHPGVAEIAIVGMPDPVLVERVCAFVVPVAGAQVTLESLCSVLHDRRTALQKHPERLELVATLPKTASGKVQKFALRERMRSAVDSSTRPP